MLVWYWVSEFESVSVSEWVMAVEKCFVQVAHNFFSEISSTFHGKIDKYISQIYD